MQLRDYQERAIQALRTSYRSGHRAPLLVAPTGSGKTVIAAEIIQSAVAKGSRSLFVAPRRELIGQTVRKLADAGVHDVRVIQAARDEGATDSRVIVGSIQTLTLPRWLGQLPQADLVIPDEAHHMAATQWGQLAGAYPKARWLGLTATPQRADGRPLGDIFDDIIVAATVRELTDRGCLVPCRVLAPSAELEPKQIAMDAVAAMRLHAAGELAVVFCATVSHAAEVARELGDCAAVISGRTPANERDSILSRFASGQLRVLVNCGVLTEGWDCPPVSVCILARRFGHAGLFLQCVGRVLRPSPGKTRALVVDLCGSVHRHGLPDAEREYSLTGKAISSVVKDSLSQCRECGSVFLAGPCVCPYCGAELPRRELAAMKVTGAALTEVQTPAPRREYVVSMRSKRRGTCARCRGPIDIGERIAWATLAKQASHLVCPAW